MSGAYDIIQFTSEDGYDNIDDINVTDRDVPIKVTRREGPLPTPGYESLLPQRSAPTVYSPVDTCEQPLDKEDTKMSTGHTTEGTSKSDAVEHSVKVKVKCPGYIELIS